jgi:hypothetical protein
LKHSTLSGLAEVGFQLKPAHASSRGLGSLCGHSSVVVCAVFLLRVVELRRALIFWAANEATRSKR